MFNKILNYIKDHYKFLIVIFLLILTFTLEFPYYINAPGGTINVSDRVSVYKSNVSSSGSFNLLYVSEYKATLFTLGISLFNKDFKVIKESEVLSSNEDDNDYYKRDKLLLEESNSNAILNAYKKAEKDIYITNRNLYVSYISENSKTNLSIGDMILQVDDKSVNTKEEIDEIVNSHKLGDKIILKVKNDDKVYEKEATITTYNDKKVIGIILSSILDLETNPKVEIHYKSSETGPSGGLIMALEIYNRLTSADLTKSYKIAGTGTIDYYGNIGSVGGIEYKLKSAVKDNCDIFIVPIGDNYNEAIKVKNKNNYKIDIIGVKTFDEAINALENI